MIDIIEHNREAIIALCEETEIAGLWLFGSAATGTWDPEKSDLDFLFDIGDYSDRAGRRSMRLAAGLEQIVGENFDLVSRPAIKRPEFRESVYQTAIAIYER